MSPSRTCSARPGAGSPPGGPGKRGRWESGISVRWDVPERAGNVPQGPTPMSQCTASSQAGPVATALFSVPRVSKGCWKRRKTTGRAGTPVQSPMSSHSSREWGQGRPLPQRGGSNRYSRSGCQSLCSLFLFLANSLSMAITSVSNSAGVGFASEGKTGTNQLRAVPRCHPGVPVSHPGVPGHGHTYQWPSNKCPSRYWAR